MRAVRHACPHAVRARLAETCRRLSTSPAIWAYYGAEVVTDPATRHPLIPKLVYVSKLQKKAHRKKANSEGGEPLKNPLAAGLGACQHHHNRELFRSANGVTPIFRDLDRLLLTEPWFQRLNPGRSRQFEKYSFCRSPDGQGRDRKGFSLVIHPRTLHQFPNTTQQG